MPTACSTASSFHLNTQMHLQKSSLAPQYNSRTLFPQVSADESKTRRHDILQNAALPPSVGEDLESRQPQAVVQPPTVPTYGIVFGLPVLLLNLLFPSDSLCPKRGEKVSFQSAPLNVMARRVAAAAQTTTARLAGPCPCYHLVPRPSHLAFAAPGSNGKRRSSAIGSAEHKCRHFCARFCNHFRLCPPTNKSHVLGRRNQI